MLGGAQDTGNLAHDSKDTRQRRGLPIGPNLSTCLGDPPAVVGEGPVLSAPRRQLPRNDPLSACQVTDYLPADDSKLKRILCRRMRHTLGLQRPADITRNQRLPTGTAQLPRTTIRPIDPSPSRTRRLPCAVGPRVIQLLTS